MPPPAIDTDKSRMRSAERHRMIRDLFASQEFMDAETLCRKLRVSDSTVRRDLIEMEAMGILRRVHGGAISLQVRDEALDFARLSSSCHAEKERIGKAAAALVGDGQNLILAPGSTVVEVAKHLGGRQLQVVTNSIPVAQVFWDSKSVEVTMTGGYVFPRIGFQLGPVCEQMLDRISADVLIMGIAGIAAEGLSDSNTLIVSTFLKMMHVARRVIVVADHTKFGRRGLMHVAPLDKIDTVVTDRGATAEHRELLSKHGVECILA
jgi:DeoR family fructose operon transcriptional repressor